MRSSQTEAAPPTQTRRFAACAGGCITLVLAGEALGYGACVVSASAPASLAAFGCLLAGGVVAGAAGGLVLARWMQNATHGTQELRAEAALVPQLTDQAAAWRVQQRQLRHDIRGALSPALLTADRLLAHGEPPVKRSGEIVVRSVEKAITLLADAPAKADAPSRKDAQNSPEGLVTPPGGC